MRIPFKRSVEVEVYFDQIELKAYAPFFGGSRFEIIPDSRESKNRTSPFLGKTTTWKIDNNRAIAFFSPWVFAPYGDGGTVKLELILETKSGDIFSKTWVFNVGRNPAVYAKEF